MATIYVSPLGSGNGSGSSAANAKAFSGLNGAINAAGAGGTVILLADQGVYKTTGSISLSAGGLPGAPVTLRGADSLGNAMDIQIHGTRAPNYSSGMTAVGNDVFRMLDGASNLVFDGFDFYNVQTGFRLGATAQNITIQNMEGDNVRYFINNHISGTSTSATVTGLTIKDVEVHGFSKSVVKLGYNTNNVIIERVYGDSEYQDGDKFAMGVMLDGTVHNVLIKNSTMLNAIATAATGTYWNGDGFVTERGVYNVRFENTLAAGNADGGYDLKSKSTVLVNVVAEDNGRNFRFWGEIEMINGIGIDPHKRGGSGNQTQIDILNGANVIITGGEFVDSGSGTKVVVNDGTGTVRFNGSEFVHASGGTLKAGSSSVLGLDLNLVRSVSATGFYSTNGEILLGTGSGGGGDPVDKVMTGTSGNDVLAPATNDDWTVSGLGGADSITTLGGSDSVTGGSGDDKILTGGGDDTLRFSGSGNGFDTIDGGAGSDRMVATANGTVIGIRGITGIEAISSNGFSSVSIKGSSASDLLDFSNVSLSGIGSINGGSGNDTISGSGSADVIAGGAGADILRGNGGSDRFDFNKASESPVAGADRILDFQLGLDRVDLSGIDANSQATGNQAFKFLGEAGFTKHAGELRIDRGDPAVTTITGDLNGDGVADFAITLTGQFQLSSGDFLL